MRKLAFIPLGALLGTLLFALPAGASGATQTFDVTNSGPYLDQCSGLTGTLTDTYHQVVLESVNAAGIYHLNISQNGTVNFVPDPTLFPGAPSFTGTFHGSEVINSPVVGVKGSVTNLTTVNGFWSDGSHGAFQMIFHLTVNANGTVTVEFSGLNCIGSD